MPGFLHWKPKQDFMKHTSQLYHPQNQSHDRITGPGSRQVSRFMPWILDTSFSRNDA